MIGDGNGQKPETDRFKRLYFSLPMRLGDFRFEPYADYQSVRVNLPAQGGVATDSMAVDNDQPTWKAFAGYEFGGVRDRGRGPRSRQSPGTRADPRSRVRIGVRTWDADATVAAFARFDHWAVRPRAANRVDSRLWIAGVD